MRGGDQRTLSTAKCPVRNSVSDETPDEIAIFKDRIHRKVHDVCATRVSTLKELLTKIGQ